MSRTHGHDPKRAILYSRVSTDEQARSGYSLAQQLEALRDHADREGYEILEEVSDPGQCGASLEWPGMNWVRGLVATGGSAVVPARDRDRCAREPVYHCLQREFEEHATKIRALNDRGDERPGGGTHGRYSRPARQVREGQDRRVLSAGQVPRVREGLARAPASPGRYLPSRNAGPRIKPMRPDPFSTRAARVSSSPHSHSKVLRPSAYQSSSRPSRTSRSPHLHSRTICSEVSISKERRM